MNKGTGGIFLILLIFSFFVISFMPGAYAESGSISSYIVTMPAEYNTGGGGSFNAGAVWTPNMPFRFDYADYTGFTEIETSGWVFGSRESDSTGFTITGGGTGSGIVTYQKSTGIVTWYGNNVHISGSEISMTYDRDIFTGFVSIDGTWGSTGAESLNAPVCLHRNVPINCVAGPQYNVVVFNDVSLEYNVSYFPNGETQFFLANIFNKYGNSKASLIDNNFNNYFIDSDFSTISTYNISRPYGKALLARLQTSSGQTVIKSINTTIIATAGGGGGGVNFTKSNYVVGEYPVISWTIPNYNSSYRYWLMLNDMSVIENIPLTGNTTSTLEFTHAGTWKASIVALDTTCTLATFYCWIPGDIAAGYTQVASGESVLLANITANKTTYGFRETWNFTVKVTGSNKYLIHAYDPDGWHLFAIFPGTEVSGNKTILYSPISYTVAGNWTAKVYDIVNSIYVAETKYQVIPTVEGYYVGYLRILEEKIELDTQSYFTVDYSSNGSGVITILRPDQSVFSTPNVANGTDRQVISIPSNSPLGYWTAALVDQSAAYSSQIMVTKNGTVVSQNGTFVIFTDKTAYNRREIAKVTFKFPANYANLSMVLYDANSKIIASAKLPPPEKQIFGYATVTIGTTGTSGIWTLALEDDSKTRYASTTFSVSSTGVVIPTETPKTISENTDSLLSGNFFVIILIMLAFVGIGTEIGGAVGAAVGFGSGFIVLAVLQLMPQWAILLFAIFVIVVFAGMAGKTLTTGGKG